MGDMGVFDLMDAGVAWDVDHNIVANALQNPLHFPGVPANVILAENIDGVLGWHSVTCTNDMAHQAIVGNMMAARLAYSLITLAAEGHHLAPVHLLGLSCHRMDIVTDKSHRAGGTDHDSVGIKYLHHFLDGLLQLLFTAKDNIRLLHVGGEAVFYKVLCLLIPSGLVAPGTPGIEAAADGAVGNDGRVLDGPQHHSLAPGVAAAAVGHDAGNGARIGRYLMIVLGFFNHMKLTVFIDTGTVFIKNPIQFAHLTTS